MMHRFEVVYALDTTLACAVATYLDAEHYAFLHGKYSPRYEVIAQAGRTIRIAQSWRFNGMRVGQTLTTEYVPPGQFLNYDIAGLPAWLPSIHHLVKSKTELFYYPDDSGRRTISHLVVELEAPAILKPLLSKLEANLTALKKEKDLEDMEMIFRRERLFGRGNIRGYLADHQFMLHKDAFVQHFGNSEAERRAAELSLAAAPPSARRSGVVELGVGP